MPRQRFNKLGIISSIFVSLILIVVSLLIVINKQYIIDQISVWRYSPTIEINSLAERSGIDGYGKFLYLASQPSLDATQNFNDACDRVENITSILGCYSDYKIYIYDVTDVQLDGVREVTAAHEMLHAAYARMSIEEQADLNLLLEAEYGKLEANNEFSDRMAFYARTEPGQRDNELHSVIGTEVSNIDPELEAHYDKYFSDRQKVVALGAKYSSVFHKLEDRANELTAQLNALALSISNDSSEYDTDINTLNSDILSFNFRANNGGFSTMSQFYYERSVLYNRVTNLDAMRVGIVDDISRYNAILDEYNSNTSQLKKLYSSIDSTLAPVPSV
ncbi:MAG TPA: hypothetical protein VFD55_02800 [Candidatus Angelobacter sp.]|nr:hypothetical protein [Candidatus Angelobacter sp.]